MFCPITHESHCKCLYVRDKVCSLKVDLKSSLRKLWTDHAVFTALVMKSIVDNNKDTKVLLDRLLLNQKDIGDQLKPIIGENKGNELTNILKEHIKLAGDVITAAVKNDGMLEIKIKNLFNNSDQVALILSSLNEYKLCYEITQNMFHIHNQFVIDMTVERIKGNYSQEIKLYDSYYNEILAMSDIIYDAL